MGISKRSNQQPYQLKDELMMWREAKRYYLEQGWVGLAADADAKCERIACILGVCFDQSGNASVTTSLIQPVLSA